MHASAATAALLLVDGVADIRGPAPRRRGCTRRRIGRWQLGRMGVLACIIQASGANPSSGAVLLAALLAVVAAAGVRTGDGRGCGRGRWGCGVLGLLAGAAVVGAHRAITAGGAWVVRGQCDSAASVCMHKRSWAIRDASHTMRQAAHTPDAAPSAASSHP